MVLNSQQGAINATPTQLAKIPIVSSMYPGSRRLAALSSTPGTEGNCSTQNRGAIQGLRIGFAAAGNDSDRAPESTQCRRLRPGCGRFVYPWLAQLSPLADDKRFRQICAERRRSGHRKEGTRGARSCGDLYGRG